MCKSVTTSKTTLNLRTRSLPEEAIGPVPISMTNDYLFITLMQKNNRVLTGLICSLLHLQMEQVHSVEITNPIDLGETIFEKTLIFDIHVLMNNHTKINLEMQVVNEQNWPERSLIYLSRTFDSLNSGEKYQQVKSAVQIGILDYTLFPEHPEFYATYYMSNEKTHQKYSDKFRLSVLDLTHIDLATNEDRLYGIDQWASFFKATTWEELKALAKRNPILGDAAATIYEVSQDKELRLQCQLREDYLIFQRMNEKKHEDTERNYQQLSVEYAKVIDEKTQLSQENTQLFQEKAQLQQLLISHGIPVPENLK